MRVGGRGRRRRRHRTYTINHDIDNGSRTDAKNLDSNINFISVGDIMTKSNRSHFKWTIIASSALFALMVPVTTGVMLPAWKTQSEGMGRNIRHLPCVSRRTGETGMCMFAYSCAKANGTHLGTCIDRFYFGSCCKIANGADIDLEPIANNHLSNKEDTFSTKPYHKPSTHPLPDFTDEFSSTISLPVSMSTMSRPLSVSAPSSVNDFHTSTFIKTSSKPPPPVHTVAYDSVPTSRTPLVNVTFSQSYSTPSTHVTSSPVVYSTTVTTTFQTGTHKPVPVYSTTAYSKPLTKPTVKPSSSKPKPSSKPGTVKPKPKPTIKPATSGTPSYPTAYTPASSTVSSFLNKTTLHSSFTNNGLSSKPSFVTESVPIKPSYTSTPGIPTPINQFTKKPTKPTQKPSSSTASLFSSNNYVKIPVSTVPQSKPSTTMSSLSSHLQTIHTTISTQSYPTPATEAVSSESTFLKMNTTITENEITDRPIHQFWSTTPDKPSHPWVSMTTTSTTPQPSLVTWTTIEEVPEVPAVILPDRTKPTSIVRPSGKPPVTKPTFLPTFMKPSSSSTGRPSSKPPRPTFKPDIEENYRPTITPPAPTSVPSSSSSTGTSGSSPSWVEVSVTTHAPTSQSSGTMELTGITTLISPSSSKPTTTLTIPVASPLPIDTTPSSSIETNEIESPAVNVSNYREVCGRRLFPTARIVGGEKASFGKWPWQISLRQWRTSTYLHKCGAALFNENWAVTAAHCVENVPPSDLLLRLGEYDLLNEDEPYGFQERRVQIVASHPQFDPRTFEYDLALLRFYEPVEFQPNIIPICVPEDDTNFVGSSAFVTGWGRLYEDGPLPNVLQEVSVPVINNSVCEKMYQDAGYIEHIPNIFICAGWTKGGFDSCEGDSGGPMVIQRPDKRWLLAGIISWGIGCAEPNQPGVYTRISAFRDWINQILQF